MTAAPREVAIRSGVVRAGGVFLDGSACAVIWPVLRRFVNERARDGGRVRPEFAEALAALRQAALEFHTAPAMSANGPGGRTLVDIVARSARESTLSTAAMAGRLGVGARQARRIAAAQGVCPIARDVWAAEDVAALTASRSAGAGRSPR